MGGAGACVRLFAFGQGECSLGVLVLMVLWDTVCRDAVCGELFEVLVTVRAHSCDIDARVPSGMQVTVQARVCILMVGCKGAAVWGAGAEGVLRLMDGGAGVGAVLGCCLRRCLTCWPRWCFGMLGAV